MFDGVGPILLRDPAGVQQLVIPPREDSSNALNVTTKSRVPRVPGPSRNRTTRWSKRVKPSITFPIRCLPPRASTPRPNDERRTHTHHRAARDGKSAKRARDGRALVMQFPPLSRGFIGRKEPSSKYRKQANPNTLHNSTSRDFHKPIETLKSSRVFSRPRGAIGLLAATSS